MDTKCCEEGGGEEEGEAEPVFEAEDASDSTGEASGEKLDVCESGVGEYVGGVDELGGLV